ncbi:MAG: hypothetical protein JOY83_00125 [Alphaproteobacteria bacterium]|nr:hypothetical protein [Alphaproteobacteria bacterium]
MIQTVQTSRFEPSETNSQATLANSDQSSATGSLIALDQGLYVVEIGETQSMPGRVLGLRLPSVQISSPPDEQDRSAEIIGSAGRSDMWLGREGGTVVIKSPAGGALVLITTYGLPAQVPPAADVQVRRLDRPKSNGAARRSADPAEEPEEILCEIVLHMERLGDRRFPGEGWVGNRGKRLRIEAFSIRPVGTLLARDIEFRAVGPKGRQTPWVTDAKLCGTRGQSLPLTGFAIRLAPNVAERFDVIYQGAFFESGVVGPNRNGELCAPHHPDDPLEAINVRVVRRSDR